MTVTVEFAPTARPGVTPVRPLRPAGRAATIRPVRPVRPVRPGRPVHPVLAPDRSSCLAEPVGQPIAASSTVQLTRRGWATLLGVAAAVAFALVWIGYLSHPGAGSTGSETGSVVGSVAGGSAAVDTSRPVVVHAGDTLWSIAERVAPGEDPRAVVWELQRLNHLDSPQVMPGQVLALR